MGRPSCCKPRSQAPGIAAVALIIGAGILAGKGRLIADRVLHDVIEVLRIAAITTAAIAAAAITAWILILLVRWQLRRRQAEDQVTAKVARAREDIAATLARVLDDETDLAQIYAMHGQQAPASTGSPSCVACGGAGEVLRSNGDGRFEARACPECRPARLAR
jgi:ADP-ribosylglycohydrolase